MFSSRSLFKRLKIYHDISIYFIVIIQNFIHKFAIYLWALVEFKDATNHQRQVKQIIIEGQCVLSAIVT